MTATDLCVSAHHRWSLTLRHELKRDTLANLFVLDTQTLERVVVGDPLAVVEQPLVSADLLLGNSTALLRERLPK